ncbi:unnamed protein product [Allacma fusca]|uniref:Uncharacterized protein n=1 Tax=Allacma fusca TaxID=39272 RepID=A0A8J2NGC2_9HEXA|nr:unnamed protein product [Allacma fusca]
MQFLPTVFLILVISVNSLHTFDFKDIFNFKERSDLRKGEKRLTVLECYERASRKLKPKAEELRQSIMKDCQEDFSCFQFIDDKCHKFEVTLKKRHGHGTNY